MKKTVVSASLALLFGLVVAPPRTASAQPVCANPANLTTNCGFDADYAGWSIGSGTPGWNGAGGNDANGSLSLVSNDTMGSFAQVSQCVSTGVVGSSAYGYGMFVSVVAGTLQNAYIMVQRYAATTCSGSYLGGNSATTALFPTTWNKVADTITTEAGTQSVLLTIFFDSGSAFTVGVDDVFFGQNLTPVELMSFSAD